MPEECDHMPEDCDHMPKECDDMPEECDDMPEECDHMPEECDHMPEEHLYMLKECSYMQNDGYIAEERIHTEEWSYCCSAISYGQHTHTRHLDQPSWTPCRNMGICGRPL